MAAPDEPDVAAGGDTPSGGTLRRLLSREGNPLFGSRPNGSLAPPLSVPVDPLLAGPPMDRPMDRPLDGPYEREAPEFSGNGTRAGPGDVPVDEVPVDEVPVDEVQVDEVQVDGGSVDEGSVDEGSVDDAGLSPNGASPPHAGRLEVSDAEDEPGERQAGLDQQAGAAQTVTDDAPDAPDATDAVIPSGAWLGPGAYVPEDLGDARTAVSPLVEPLTQPVDFVDAPSTVAVPALMPAPVEPEAPGVEAPVTQPGVPPPPRRRRARPRVRKVTRIVRYVDAWSVFKVALLLNAVLAAVMVTASVLLWNLAYSTDVIDNVEGVIEDWLAYETFTFDGASMFRAVVVLAGLFVIAATGLAVIAATLFNLISDLTGGVKVTVLEREVIAAPPPGARKVRGGAARRAAARQAAAASRHAPMSPGSAPVPNGQISADVSPPAGYPTPGGAG